MVPCPAGQFATEAGSLACSVPGNGQYIVDASAGALADCEPGYYCQSGVKNDCGSANLICPNSSMISPYVVQTGYYSTGGTSNATRTDQTKCEPGNYCVGGGKKPCTDGKFATEAGSVQSSVLQNGPK